MYQPWTCPACGPNQSHRWVMTYNANLDKSASHQKSLAELRAELRRWEELQRLNTAKKRERENASGDGGAVGEDAVKYQVCTVFWLSCPFSSRFLLYELLIRMTELLTTSSQFSLLEDRKRIKRSLPGSSQLRVDLQRRKEMGRCQEQRNLYRPPLAQVNRNRNQN